MTTTKKMKMKTFSPQRKARKDLCWKVAAKDRFAESISKLLNYTMHAQKF